MDTLYYSTLDHPIEVDPAIGDGYSGELADTNVQDCSMNYTAGRLRPTVFYSFYLTNLQFLIVLPSKRVTWKFQILCTIAVLNRPGYRDLTIFNIAAFCHVVFDRKWIVTIWRPRGSNFLSTYQIRCRELYLRPRYDPETKFKTVATDGLFLLPVPVVTRGLLRECILH